jgi:hypothetical protein
MKRAIIFTIVFLTVAAAIVSAQSTNKNIERELMLLHTNGRRSRIEKGYRGA